MYNYYSNVQKRKVFISYYHGDQEAVNKFVRDFGDVFIPKTVGVKDGDFDFDSNDPQYIMRKIREQKLEDSTVTIVLVGSCTHSRRYVDWEVKASLQQGQSLPNGLIAINLPYMGMKGAYLLELQPIENLMAQQNLDMQDIIHILHRRMI